MRSKGPVSDDSFPPPKVVSGTVYVLHAPFYGAIKVGMTVGHVSKRISRVQVSCPEPLTTCLLLSVSDVNFEDYIHRIVRPHRTNGEWFRWPDCRDNLVHAIKSYPKDVGLVPGCWMNNDIGIEIVRLSGLSPKDEE